jgi:hypothetical protein
LPWIARHGTGERSVKMMTNDIRILPAAARGEGKPITTIDLIGFSLNLYYIKSKVLYDSASGN